MSLPKHYLLRVDALLADVDASFRIDYFPALQVKPFVGGIVGGNLGDCPVAVSERVEGCVLEP